VSREMSAYLVIGALSVIVGVLIFWGISNRVDEKNNSVPPTVVVEGHEYFKSITYGGNPVLTHKGNCKLCAELYLPGERER
jgi:hypothetical protein